MTHRPKPPTIYDVASAAGVSHQTVSRFLKGYAGIRPETREKVTRALQQLGYRPNLTARSLKSGRSLRIGALTHELGHTGPRRVAEGASIAAREAGYVLDLVTIEPSDSASIAQALQLLTEHDLAGVLVFSSTDETTAAFRSADIRVPSLIWAESDSDPHTGASRLLAEGIPEAVSYLAQLGHERVMHVSGPGDWVAARNRLRGYLMAVAPSGLRSVNVISGDWSARSGFDAIMRCESLHDATAILAANDQMALGAMLALKRRGYRIPEDINVVGIDDIPDAAYFDPPLTTIRLDLAAQGRIAVHTLLQQITADPAPPPPLPTPELIIRASTGPAPGS